MFSQQDAKMSLSPSDQEHSNKSSRLQQPGSALTIPCVERALTINTRFQYAPDARHKCGTTMFAFHIGSSRPRSGHMEGKTERRQEQLVCRKSWLRKIRVEHGHESVCSRQHRLHQPINFLCTDMNVRVAIRLCAFLCRSHAVARNGLKASSTVPFPSNYTTSKREITIGFSHVFPLARPCHTVPSLSASSQL